MAKLDNKFVFAGVQYRIKRDDFGKIIENIIREKTNTEIKLFDDFFLEEDENQNDELYLSFDIWDDEILEKVKRVYNIEDDDEILDGILSDIFSVPKHLVSAYPYSYIDNDDYVLIVIDDEKHLKG